MPTCSGFAILWLLTVAPSCVWIGLSKQRGRGCSHFAVEAKQLVLPSMTRKMLRLTENKLLVVVGYRYRVFTGSLE